MCEGGLRKAPHPNAPNTKESWPCNKPILKMVRILFLTGSTKSDEIRSGDSKAGRLMPATAMKDIR